MKIYLNSAALRFIRLPLLLAAALVILTPFAAAAGTSHPGTILSAADLQKIFVRRINRDSAATAAAGRQRQIINFNSSPETIELPPGVISYQTISKTKNSEPGRQIVRLAILVNGREQARVTLSGDVQLLGDVVCLSRALQRHTILTPDDLDVVHRNIGQLGADFIADPRLVVGRELKTTLQTGAIIYGRLLKNPTMVKRGALVSIMAISGPLTIKAAGQVKTAGAKGDIVRVKNLMSRREIYARVISPSEVQVDF
ncbi:MAG: flagellar basal body P-ring formation protein FlgA [Deltaproteobacteria bacterium]|nr:flagellar basal body P-ring formation protein FlgA [Deltaproteobacteria bacterium]